MEVVYLLAEGVGGIDPGADNNEEDHSQVRCGGREGPESHDHDLLNQASTRFAQRVADNIDGCLPLGLQDIRLT